VPADHHLSYEELAAENAQLQAMMSELRVVVEQLRAENAELRRQLGQNSRNSSKPPSSDSPFAKAAPKSLRRKSGRKPGGQPGHRGATLALVDKPDERLRHEPGPCIGCGADLANAPEVGMERRQVFDLPPMTVRVTEHQLIARRCGCGTTTCGTAPEGVTAPVQYGSRITAIILYLYVGQFLSKKRTAQALAELFGTPVSEGTVATVTNRAADGLKGFLEEVTDRIAGSEVVGFDETGLRVAGRLHWVHCARTSKYTLITCHPKRGSEGLDAAGVLTRFRGVSVHDAWAPYDSYVDVEHQLCCAHALRGLAAVADTAEPDADWCWATQASDALVAIQKLVVNAIARGADAVDPDAPGQAGPALPLRRPDRHHLHHRPQRQGDAQAQRAGPQAARPARRLPPLHHRLANTARQQRLRARYPHDQAPAKGVRLPAHPRRSHTLLRNPQLPLHRRQARTKLLRHPRHAHRKPTLATHTSINHPVTT
jgi:transposase